ncbi:cysteine proteinase [Marasmius fiardii PR-910]|nr:cysteine proteinase [Marasmius fiardii PR-910]
MPILVERDRTQLDQLHGTIRAINPTYDTTASIKMSSSKWKNEKPTPITTPSNPSIGNPFSNRFRNNLHDDTSNPVRNATLITGTKRKRRIEPTFDQPIVFKGQTKKRLQVMLPTESDLDAMSPPEPITISDEEDDMDTRHPLENNLSQMTRIERPTEPSNRLRPLSEHRPAYVADKSKLEPSPSPSSSIESFGAEQRPGNVQQKVNLFDNLTNGHNDPRLDLRKLAPKDAKGVKDRMKGQSRRVVPTFQEDPIATSTTPYENKGKAKQTQIDIRIPVAEWFMGPIHFSEPCTVSVVRESLQIQTSTSSLDLPFSEINTATIMEEYQIFPARSNSDRSVRTGERSGMVTFRAHPHDSLWKTQRWDALQFALKRCLSNRCTVVLGDSSNQMWEAACRNKVATCSDETIIEDEDESSITPTSSRKAIPNITKVVEERSPPVQASIKTFLGSSKESRLKSQATYRSSSRSLPTAPDNAEQDAPPQNLPRRSARQVKPKQEPAVDLDEVILVYPPFITGAVNITNADLNRLQPGEFLNDTLIEFGLKLWHKELEESSPELAKQIHIFNSFFYKKLNKKNIEESYKTVARWTNKIDIFQKTYVVVPINENAHWYLAIIYQPQYVLIRPEEKVLPVTRGRARLSQAQAVAVDKVEESLEHVSEPQADEMTSNKTEAKEDTSDTVIGVDDSPEDPKTEDEEIDELMESDPEPDLNIIASAANAPDDQSDLDPTPMEVDGDDDGGNSEKSVSEHLQYIDISVADDDVTMTDPEEMKPQDNEPPSNQPIPPEDFYAKPPSGKGKGKAFEVDEPIEIVDPLPGTMKPLPYIIVMDSLGSKHQRAVTTLSNYLKYEAMDKLKREPDTLTKPVGKFAQVPMQPNFCDCGIYLLHFVRTFVSKTDHLVRVITRERGRQSDERKEDWDARDVVSYREQLSDRIKELSKEWKKERAVRSAEEPEEKKEKVFEIITSSDSEIDIVGENTTSSKKKATRQKSKQNAKQNTQKAERLR